MSTPLESDWTIAVSLSGDSQEWRMPEINLMKPGFVDTPTIITEALSVSISLKGQGPEEYQSQAFQGYEHRGSQKIFDVLSGRWAKKTLQSCAG